MAGTTSSNASDAAAMPRSTSPTTTPQPKVRRARSLSRLSICISRTTPDAELERTLVSNFQNEAVALDRVRHPNVINRLGHGTAIDLAGTTFHYIVLEYLPGGDMFALTKTRPLSIQRALFYLEQVCSGLAHAHKCGVIHRDIKPQNLLLTADKEIVKIADFGVARLDATEGAITRVGTNIYSAPEHNPLMQTGQLDTAGLRLPHDHLTPAADIYSLAKTTYTLARRRIAAPFCATRDDRVAVARARNSVGQTQFCACLKKRRRAVPKHVIKQSKSSGTRSPMRVCRRLGRCKWSRLQPCRCDANRAKIFRSSLKKTSLKRRRRGRTSQFRISGTVLARTRHGQTAADRGSDQSRSTAADGIACASGARTREAERRPERATTGQFGTAGK